jgi:hypothetical protein
LGIATCRANKHATQKTKTHKSKDLWVFFINTQTYELYIAAQ